MGWKYIMMEVTLGERMNKADELKILMPVIFPDKMVHSIMAEAMRTVLATHGMARCEPVSAGSIEHIKAIDLDGESETLGIASKPGDTEAINMYSYLHGIQT